ncbi:phage head-tail connector protein [Acetobacterium wieringae]|uniref:Phage head-tail connector protein n=1 Tax=Acetobacterium wieringae TaxID=52694 RepID=A0ABY6HGB0_9FIRM|nr:phage head-tail connector protein [Acetobacterium wieringae]UYO63437.1 phage head-tail connector protein [Acetobacterium wieringae]VUZ23453.1 Uncharacterised protein [Acetobacterium wieringae]
MELEKLKQLLGITGTDQDALLQFCIDSVTETITDYCHVDTIPGGAMNTAYRMAMDLYRHENIGDTGLSPGVVASQSMGDVSISYREDSTYTQSLLKNYRAQLSRYRKLSW